MLWWNHALNQSSYQVTNFLVTSKEPWLYCKQLSNVTTAVSIKPTCSGKVLAEFGGLPHGSVLTYQVVALPITSTPDYQTPFPLSSQSNDYATTLNDNGSYYCYGMAVTLSDAVTGDGNKRTEHKQHLAAYCLEITNQEIFTIFTTFFKSNLLISLSEIAIICF